MEPPRGKVHVQAGMAHLVPVPVIGLSAEEVGHPPRPAPELAPWQLDQSLSRRRRIIHDDKETLVRALPAPANQIRVADVIRPAGPVAEPPVTLPQSLERRRLDQRPVEGRESGLPGFVRAAAEE